MPLVPNRFLFRVAVPCVYVEGLPRDGDDLLDLPTACRIEGYSELDEGRDFADVRMAWNEGGLALQVEVRGKDKPLVGDSTRPRQSDGVTLWLDLRDARTSHRASRFCFQFHFLPTGGGPERDQPVFVQTKIHRALQDAPIVASTPFTFTVRGAGYKLEAFLPAEALPGFDPEQNPRLGVFYAVQDQELGVQTLGAAEEFPYAEDPSLWSVLVLTKGD
jgi:hypothetical protein